MISSLVLSSTGTPFTSSNLSPGSSRVSLLCCTMVPGSAKMTARIVTPEQASPPPPLPCALRSSTIARRSENPKSLRGGFCRWIVRVRGLGSTSGAMSGSGRLTSSKFAVLDHLKQELTIKVAEISRESSRDSPVEALGLPHGAQRKWRRRE